MLRLAIASLLAAAFACVPIPEAGSSSVTPPVTVVTSRKAVRIVPARDGGMTCLTADDVRRLQTYLDRCPTQDR